MSSSTHVVIDNVVTTYAGYAHVVINSVTVEPLLYDHPQNHIGVVA